MIILYVFPKLFILFSVFRFVSHEYILKYTKTDAYKDVVVVFIRRQIILFYLRDSVYRKYQF